MATEFRQALAGGGSTDERSRERWLVASFGRSGWSQGARVMTPLAIAIGIWGLVTGVAMSNAGLPLGIGIMFTLTAFAGSAQLAVLPLLAVHAPLPIVWLTAALVNLRFVIFSGAMRPYFAALPLRQRLFASYFNGDVGSAVFMRRFEDDADRCTPEQLGFFYATAWINWWAWQLASIAGMILGDVAPTDWGLELGATLALVAVLIPMLSRMPAAAGALVAAVVAVVAGSLPMRLGLVVAVVAGLGTATLLDRSLRRPTLPSPSGRPR